MRYRVEFRYREDTGEVELLQVEVVETGQRAPDHDEQHDRVAAEVASVVEQFAQIDEVTDPGASAGRARLTQPGEGTAATEEAQRVQELGSG